MKTCPECGSENRDGALFCLGCGAHLPRQATNTTSLSCSNCGAPNRRGAHFCLNCGKSLADENHLADIEEMEESVAPVNDATGGSGQAPVDDTPLPDDEDFAADGDETDASFEDDEMAASFEEDDDYIGYHEDDMAIPLEEWEKLQHADPYEGIKKEDLYKMSIGEVEARAKAQQERAEVAGGFASLEGDATSSSARAVLPIVFHPDGTSEPLNLRSEGSAAVAEAVRLAGGEAEPDWVGQQTSLQASMKEGKEPAERHCPYCGAVNEAGEDFCSSCGQPILIAEESSYPAKGLGTGGAKAKTPDRPKRSGKKATWFLLAICLLAIAGLAGYKYAEASVSKEKQVADFVELVRSGDSQAVAEEMQSQDKTLSLSGRTVGPLVDYVSANETLLNRLAKQLATGESRDFGLTVKEKGKIWGLFPRYVYAVKPVYAYVTTNKKGVNFYTLGEKWATSDSTHYKGKIGPLVPGKYTFRAVLTGKKGKDQVVEKTKLVIPSNSHPAEIAFEMVEIPVKSKDKKAKDADVLVNGRKVGRLKDGQAKVGPFFYEKDMQVALKDQRGHQSQGVRVPKGQPAAEMELDMNTQANKKELARLKEKEQQRQEQLQAAKREAEAQKRRTQQAQAAARQKAEEAARQKAAEDTAKQEAEAKRKADEKAKQEAEAKRKADEKAKQEAEAKRKADEKAKQEAEAKRKADEKAKQEAEAKRKAEEAARKREEEIAQQKRQEEEAKRRAEEEQKRKAEEEKKRQEEAKKTEQERVQEANDFFANAAVPGDFDNGDTRLSDDYRHELGGLQGFYQAVAQATFFGNAYDAGAFANTYFEGGTSNPAFQSLNSFIESCREASKRGEILGVKFKVRFNQFEQASGDGARKIGYEVIAMKAYPKSLNKPSETSKKTLRDVKCHFDVDNDHPVFAPTSESLQP